MSFTRSDLFLSDVLKKGLTRSSSLLKKKKTFADNLLTPMSSKMSMSFFLSSKKVGKREN